MSKNKIAELPTYIGDMNDLKILKLDNNPIRFPPKEVWNTDEKDRDLWLRNVKGFLRQHAERAQQQVQDTESTGGSRYDRIIYPHCSHQLITPAATVTMTTNSTMPSRKPPASSPT